MNSGLSAAVMSRQESGVHFCTKLRGGRIFCRLCEVCGAGLAVTTEEPTSIQAYCYTCRKEYLFRDRVF